MRAYLRSARIAPKKLSVIAQMVRGLTVPEAQESLEHTHKKGARMILALLKSATANAVHNDKQRPEDLVIRTIVVNQAQSYRRGVPMARGRMRPIRKFLSHIEIVLGVADAEGEGEKIKRKEKRKRNQKNGAKTSQEQKKAVQGDAPSKKKTTKHAASDSNTSKSV
ncbi:MAG TPA: 50S ribosomal protein L22 [Candidatus Peribacter riflensis]|uniref:Large ribosomal subunit protein uL22 n=1 Tax=Candidatus Peribacter riflensis TaxID=1735162 RepID=A0A0S1SPF0_9BACT|nr:MAG: 50S ribosomal protein L22 [Candidatus Peribacter riflensis]OGJ78124.1 MAG: 50S ribosomal protein L22 [Candidatus Peribacteria bacterium RIFOXYB1_FULL_57_12]OGJ82220.1 MAG: 50S ribosomal protein L22 [Candidatus Peribacteria bacterium RIFOXYC1_FULL_58_8]ALM10511.1 MAG: large subunit ribosomal protein L22 [Candidatus Peribacter riflensis]ALM11614.1 MAG: large subunit ribosomal protein L22 [Candidatus Peribacter riflensis]